MKNKKILLLIDISIILLTILTIIIIKSNTSYIENYTCDIEINNNGYVLIDETFTINFKKAKNEFIRECDFGKNEDIKKLSNNSLDSDVVIDYINVSVKKGNEEIEDISANKNNKTKDVTIDKSINGKSATIKFSNYKFDGYYTISYHYEVSSLITKYNDISSLDLTLIKNVRMQVKNMKLRVLFSENTGNKELFNLYAHDIFNRVYYNEGSNCYVLESSNINKGKDIGFRMVLDNFIENASKVDANVLDTIKNIEKKDLNKSRSIGIFSIILFILLIVLYFVVIVKIFLKSINFKQKR